MVNNLEKFSSFCLKSFCWTNNEFILPVKNKNWLQCIEIGQKELYQIREPKVLPYKDSKKRMESAKETKYKKLTDYT